MDPLKAILGRIKRPCTSDATNGTVNTAASDHTPTNPRKAKLHDSDSVPDLEPVSDDDSDDEDTAAADEDTSAAAAAAASVNTVAADDSAETIRCCVESAYTCPLLLPRTFESPTAVPSADVADVAAKKVCQHLRQYQVCDR